MDSKLRLTRNRIVIVCFLLCQSSISNLAAQPLTSAQDTALVNRLKLVKAKILFEVSSAASFAVGPGSSSYSHDKHVRLFNAGRILYFAKVNEKFKRVSREFKWNVNGKEPAAIYAYKDSLFRVMFIHERLNINKAGWGGTRHYYFNPDGTLLAAELWGAQRVASDDFDEIQVTNYYSEGKLVHVERRCFGSSQSCSGSEQLKFSPGKTVKTWFALKGIDPSDETIHDN